MTTLAGNPHWPAMSLAEAHKRLTAPGQRFEMAEVVIRGVPTRVWKNAPATLRDVLQFSRMYKDRTFLVYENERATYESFFRAAVAMAYELQARGVKKGDRVVIIMRNLPEWPVAFYGAVILGAIVTPLNAWWTGPELEYGLVDSGAKVAIVDAERMERIAEHLVNCPALERIYVSRYADELPHPIVTRLEDAIGAVNDWGKLPDRAMPDAAIDTDDDATILYTSGTTGKPKGALGTHRNMNSNIFAAGCSGARNFLRRGEEVPVVDPLTAPQRAALLSVPFFHATGCFAVLNPTLVAGAKIVLMRKWDVELALQLIEREKINQAGGVPTIAWQLIEHPARAKYDLSSLESVSYGGAPSAPELVRKDGGVVSEISAWQWLGHDGNLGHLHHAQRGRLRESSELVRAGRTGVRSQDHGSGSDARSARRRGGRAMGARAQHRQMLLEQARGQRADLRRRLGAARAISRGSTRKAFASSSTAPRTC